MCYPIFEQYFEQFSSVDCVQNGPTRHSAQFCCNRLNVSIKMAFNKNLSSFYIAAVRHLGFVLRMFGSPTKRRLVHRCAKFGYLFVIGVVILRYAIFNILRHRLENAYSCRFSKGFWVKMGKRKLLQFYPSLNAITWIDVL